MEVVYEELRRRARGRLRRERPDHSLSPTALVNETYLKLIDQRRVRWQDRAHFFGVAGDSPGRVYDPATDAAGGTNADDLSDALADLPVILHKESTSSMWHREEQVRQQNPDLVISHLSCLLDARKADTDALEEHLFDLAQQRLTLFFGYLGTSNPRTRFLLYVYSRSRFATPELAKAWVGNVVARFP